MGFLNQLKEFFNSSTEIKGQGNNNTDPIQEYNRRVDEARKNTPGMISPIKNIKIEKPQPIKTKPDVIPTQLTQVKQQPVNQPYIQTLKQPVQASDTNHWVQQSRPASNPYSNILQKVFGDEAPKFEQVLRWGQPTPGTSWGNGYGGENLSYDPQAEYQNDNGSLDRGLFQINSDTFDDFMKRKGDILKANGINSYDEMFDPYKNALMAKIIHDEQGFRAWYGAHPDLRASSI